MEPELLTLAERCQTCAYRPGTEANKSDLTKLKVKLCLETAEPFYCHEATEPQALCRGWVDAIELRLEKGNHGETVDWRRDVLLALNGVICDYETELEAGRTPDPVELIHRALLTQ